MCSVGVLRCVTTAKPRGAKAPHHLEIDMEVRLVKAFIHAMVWMLVGMLVMARLYCYNLGITSGPHYIGWDTTAIVVACMLLFKLLLMFDPSFKDDNRST